MARGISVHLKPFCGVRILSSLDHSGTECGRLLVCRFQIVDPEIEMDLLLLRAIRPLRWDMVRSKLEPDYPLAVHREGMPVILGIDLSIQQCCPEATLGGQIRGVDDDELQFDSHAYLPGRARFPNTTFDNRAANFADSHR